MQPAPVQLIVVRWGEASFPTGRARSASIRARAAMNSGRVLSRNKRLLRQAQRPAIGVCRE
jgi:hypothetical protein